MPRNLAFPLLNPVLARGIAITVLSGATAACQGRASATTAAKSVDAPSGLAARPDHDDPDPWEHQAWIAKAGRALRAGRALTHAEIAALAPLAKPAVVDRLMADPGFGDAVLDFNLFYLGAKPNELYQTGPQGLRAYDFKVWGKPQAIAAAQAVVTGGDFWRILDYEQPRFMPPVSPAPAMGQDGQATGGGDLAHDAENRAAIFRNAYAAMDQVASAFVGDDGRQDKGKGCAFIREKPDVMQKLTQPWNYGGYFFTLAIDLSIAVQIEANVRCGDETVGAAEILDWFAQLRASYERWHAGTPPYLVGTYALRGVMDMKAAPDLGAPFGPGTQYTFFGFWQNLPNSSTNYNRKRAAYVLKTYFCDDLTPLNVVAPQGGHAGDRHASEPSCQACHYKLDPMAGFFKEKGVVGFDFAARPFLTFDDNATLTGDALATYRAAWPEVGYVRSPRDPRVNDHGADLRDLAGIMRKAPEVKRCVVRRLAEYFLGKDQVFDGAWLEHLGERFATAPSSGVAVKSIVKDLLLSRTFTTPDPVPDQCYDHWPAGGARADGVPCAVAHVLRNNCVTCHDGLGSREPGIDFGRWVEVGRDADGRPVMGFPHHDDEGNQWSRVDSFARIAARLSSSDPAFAMPYNRDMDAVEKARLYKWLTGAGFAASAKGAGKAAARAEGHGANARARVSRPAQGGGA